MNSIVPGELQRRAARGEALPENTRLDYNEVVASPPYGGYPPIHEFAPFYLEWLSHTIPDEYWAMRSPWSGYERIQVPALKISGWYDIFLWSSAAARNAPASTSA